MGVVRDCVVITTDMENTVFAGFTEGKCDVPSEGGVKNGKGTEQFTKDGKEYTLECTWENGKKNGEAILLDPDGVMAMKLVFKDDRIEGEGSLFDNGQVTFKGHWVAGKRCGLGQEYQGGKIVFKGEYKDDVRNGYGISYDANGETVFEGEWVDGKEGDSYIEEDDNGNRVLVVKENGVVSYRGGFKEGTLLKDGKGTVFDSEGKPVKVCVFKEGELDRMVKEFKGATIVTYDANGKKQYEGEYIDDKRGRYPPNGKGRAYHNGVVVYNGDWVRGHRQGHGSSYHENHTLQYEGDWMNDMANGTGKYYNTEGMLVVEGEFVDNVCTSGEKRVNIVTGKVENPNRGSGCLCFGRRGRKQLPVTEAGEENKRAVTVHTMKEFMAVPLDAVEIVFDGNALNETEVAILDFARFENLRRVSFAEGCCRTVRQLRFRELAKLKSIAVFSGAFSNPEVCAKVKESQFKIMGERREMSVESCAALAEIVIEGKACVDFMKLSLSGECGGVR